MTKFPRFLLPGRASAVVSALAILGCIVVRAEPYELAFSTYFGGANDWDQGRDVVMDEQGNIYVTGGVTSNDYPTTDGVFQRTFDNTGDQVGSGGYCDAFVTKFDPEGNLVWSTYLGGPNYDRGYGIEVDAQGYVYVCGRAGPGFPVTTGAFQEQFKGIDAGIYGQQNGFVAKLEPDGSGVVWASYVGVASLCRDMAIDAEGNVYTHIAHESKSRSTMPTDWFLGRFRETRGSKIDNGAIKIAADGQSVIWATWLGGSGDEQKEASVRVGADNAPVLLFWTKSSDITTTEGAYSRSLNGNRDAYLVKVAADGKSLVWATYFGGPGDGGGTSTHNLAIDDFGNTFYAIGTLDGDLPVTPGAFQTTFGGGTHDTIVAKFDHTGDLVASTYLGGSGDNDEIDGIYTDVRGNIMVSGQTDSTDFPVTPGAWQSANGGGGDVFIALLSADLATLHYATYFGGPSTDYGRGSYMAPNGDIAVTGSSDGDGFPTLNAEQDFFAGGVGDCFEGGCDAGDVIAVRFNIAELDADADGLHDGWEWRHFQDFARNASTDHDADGLTELLEAALGADPTVSSTGAQPVVSVAFGPAEVRLSYIPARADVTYTPEYSHDLDSWFPDGFSIQPNGQMNEAVKEISLGDEPFFVRLKVERP